MIRFYEITLAIKAAHIPPVIGATTGIHEYFQSLSPFPLIGKNACIIRGPKSLAGLIAYPVVPPNDSPILQTRNATGIAPIEPRPIMVSVLFMDASVM